MRSASLQPIADARVVAFERDGDIHIVPAVRKSCDQWDADAAAVGGVEQVSSRPCCSTSSSNSSCTSNIPSWHRSAVIATTFERYLKADLLTVAVEDFFFSWPELSEDEEAERMDPAAPPPKKEEIKKAVAGSKKKVIAKRKKG